MEGATPLGGIQLNQAPIPVRGATQVSEQRLEYSTENDCYHDVANIRTVNVKAITKGKKTDIYKAYHNKEFDKIFSDFQPETDYVDTKHGPSNLYLLHQRLQKEMPAESLEPGFYSFEWLHGEIVIREINDILTDNYIELDHEVASLKSNIDRFFNKRQQFEDMQIKHKRGSLIYGPPGNGKTFNAIHATKSAIEKHDAIVFFLNDLGDFNFQAAYSHYENIFKDKNVIFVMEEVTEVTNRGKTKTFLSFLDGELSWRHMYCIATTNYPEKLEKNIIDRPGRFDRIIEVDQPERENRKKYLKKKLEREPTEKELDLSEGYSISHLKEIAVRMRLWDKSFEEVTQEIDEIKEKIDEHFKEESDRAGFAP